MALFIPSPPSLGGEGQGEGRRRVLPLPRCGKRCFPRRPLPWPSPLGVNNAKGRGGYRPYAITLLLNLTGDSAAPLADQERAASVPICEGSYQGLPAASAATAVAGTAATGSFGFVAAACCWMATDFGAARRRRLAG